LTLFEQYRQRRTTRGQEQHLLKVDLSWLTATERDYLLGLMESLYKDATPQQITADQIATELHRWGMVQIPGAKILAFQPDWVTPLLTSGESFREKFKDGYHLKVTPSSQVFEVHYSTPEEEKPTVRLGVMKSAHAWGFRAHTLDGVRSFRWERVESVGYGTGSRELQDYRYELFSVSNRVHMRRLSERRRVF
jgi:hypothetical protein